MNDYRGVSVLSSRGIRGKGEGRILFNTSTSHGVLPVWLGETFAPGPKKKDWGDKRSISKL